MKARKSLGFLSPTGSNVDFHKPVLVCALLCSGVNLAELEEGLLCHLAPRLLVMVAVTVPTLRFSTPGGGQTHFSPF